MTKSNLYDNTARFYDGGNQRACSEDIEFYKELLFPECKVLDIGCGTGRISLELMKENIEIVAFDYSESMLEIFREKLKSKNQNQHENLRLEEADMTNFQFNEKFDLVIFPFRVFQALTTNKQRSNCLACVKQHLNPDGKVIINMFNPNLELLNKFASIENFDYEYFDDELNVNVKRYTIGLEHNERKRTIHSKYVFELKDVKGNVNKLEDFLNLGYLFKEEADKLFQMNGFTISNLYSWWDKSNYLPNEKRELIYELQIL